MPTLILTLIIQLCLVQIVFAQNTVYANDDYINGFENQEVKIPVLNNDIGLSIGLKSLAIIEQPRGGQALVHEDNNIVYIPNYSFTGNDQFKYKVCNTDGSCDVAVVDIKVQDVNFLPLAVNDTVNYLHGGAFECDLMANDVVEGDGPVTITFLNELIDGQYYLTSDNKLRLEIERRFIGKDSLRYTICDTDNDCSEAYVFIDVRHGVDIDFYVPQGFSPNGDGVNDTFYVPDFSTYEGVSLAVADSWGSVVFLSDQYMNNWNGIANQGSHKGKLVSAGTYYYIFKVKGVSKQITGYVYITN